MLFGCLIRQSPDSLRRSSRFLSVVAGQISPLKAFYQGLNIDFNDSNTEKGIYSISNISRDTTNPPLTSSASCMYINMGSASVRIELLIGVDSKFMYGRYSEQGQQGTWLKIF